MTDFILLIIVLTPGIIGIAIDKLLNGDTSPEPLNKGIVKYFLYSSAALFATELSGWAQPLQKTLTQSNNFTLWDAAAPACAAVIIAVTWKLFFKRAVINASNKMLVFFGYNAITLPNSALENMLLDAKGHFIEIHFPDGRVIVGELVEYESTYKTITLAPLPDWVNDNYIVRYEKNNIVLFETGMVVKEFAYKNLSPVD